LVDENLSKSPFLRAFGPSSGTRVWYARQDLKDFLGRVEYGLFLRESRLSPLRFHRINSFSPLGLGGFVGISACTPRALPFPALSFTRKCGKASFPGVSTSGFLRVNPCGRGFHSGFLHALPSLRLSQRLPFRYPLAPFAWDGPARGSSAQSRGELEKRPNLPNLPNPTFPNLCKTGFCGFVKGWDFGFPAHPSPENPNPHPPLGWAGLG
jgi:hypothetical protein